ncbi:MAG: hypothetical protein ACXV2D_08805 [Halobacteriota archaeon]
MTLAPLWTVSAAGWKDKPDMTTVCALGFAVGLAADAPALGLGVAVLVAALVAAVAIGLAVAALGLGLGFDDDVHPAMNNGATTRTTVIRSKYFFNFDPFLYSLGVTA